MLFHRSVQAFFKRAGIALLAFALVAGLFAALPPTLTALASDCQKNFKVRSGDSLATIATKFDVAIDELTQANNLQAPYYTIYVQQNLCIPADAKSLGGIPKFANSLAADYTARASGKNLTIKTTNFPKTSTYYVKAGTSSGANMEKIGQINTVSGGSLTATFALPDKLQKAKQVVICLKNAMTNANICRPASR